VARRLFGRDPDNQDAANPAAQLSFAGGMREAIRGGAAHGKKRQVPPGRAERLGLTELQGRNGHPGPWPDVLLRLLARLP
jgi:hypothetical protein